MPARVCQKTLANPQVFEVLVSTNRTAWILGVGFCVEKEQQRFGQVSFDLVALTGLPQLFTTQCKHSGLPIIAQQGDLAWLHRLQGPPQVTFSLPKPHNSFGGLLNQNCDAVVVCGNRPNQ
jgi:hypothetical protein